MSLKKRKYTRLSNKDTYSIPGNVAHIVIGTDNKQPYFRNHDHADTVTQLIIKTSEENNVKLYAYCTMPDHIHMLVEASNGCSIIDFVRLIKGRFSTYCRKAGWSVKLQRSYYDHMLRKEEDIEELSRYIIGNPVRAGIASSYGVYPFAGSTVFKI